jgi:hypothetical protein
MSERRTSQFVLPTLKSCKTSAYHLGSQTRLVRTVAICSKRTSNQRAVYFLFSLQVLSSLL